MPITPRHIYDIGIHVHTTVEGRPALTRGFELDSERPPKIRVQFLDGNSPDFGWYDPIDVQPDLSICANGCFSLTKTIRGNCCERCGATKTGEDGFL